MRRRIGETEVDIEWLARSHQRLGRLEVAIPEAYKALRDAPDEELRGRVDRVFGRLLEMASAHQ